MTHGCDGQTPDAGPPGVDTGARDTQPTKPTSRADGPVASWIERVRGEYREMPGLSLTVRQAARLWGLEPSACRALFDVLQASGFLRLTDGGGYVRADRT